jgi:hypothetical protein
MPRVDDITKSLLNEAWYWHTSQHWHKGEDPNEYLRHQNPTQWVRPFVQSVYDYLDNAIGEPNYEDIYAYIEEIGDKYTLQNSDSRLGQLIDTLRPTWKNLLSTAPSGYGLSDIPEVTVHALNLIRSVVWSHLPTNAEPRQLDLISDLANAPRLNHLDIITLNHDLLIESQLAKHGIEFDDGFDAPDGDIQFFSPSLFESPNSRVRLLKLHAGIDWFIVDRNGSARQFAKLNTADVEHPRDASNNMWRIVTGYPLFLSGRSSKEQAYTKRPYNELHSRVESTLSKCRIVVASGYGWLDNGVNKYVFDWLKEDISRRLVLLAEDRTALLEGPLLDVTLQRVGIDFHKQLVWHESWLGDTSLGDLEFVFSRA